MNREQMIAKASVTLAEADNDKCCRLDALDYFELSEAVVDAILPQVTTVEEIDALPGAKFIDVDGNLWHKRRTDRWLRTDANPYDHLAEDVLAQHGPLTVVWRP